MANVNTSPYEYYLELLGSWGTSIALPTLWFCTFHLDTVGCLKSDLAKQLNDYETFNGPEGWKISKNTVKFLTSSKHQYSSDSLMGCVFVKQVNLPPEKVTASHDGLSYGGYIAPATISTRQSYLNFNVTFLETNASFLDFVIRPWIILAGYNGRIARSYNSKKNVKCSICDVVLLSKVGSEKPLGIRKIYRFNNVTPVEIGQESYSHMPDALKTTDVNFVYDGYTILEHGSTSNLL